MIILASMFQFGMESGDGAASVHVAAARVRWPGRVWDDGICRNSASPAENLLGMAEFPEFAVVTVSLLYFEFPKHTKLGQAQRKPLLVRYIVGVDDEFLEPNGVLCKGKIYCLPVDLVKVFIFGVVVIPAGFVPSGEAFDGTYCRPLSAGYGGRGP